MSIDKDNQGFRSISSRRILIGLAIFEFLAIAALLAYIFKPAPKPDYEKERAGMEEKLKEAIPEILSNQFTSSQKVEILRGEKAQELNLPHFSDYMKDYMSVAVIIKGEYKIGYHEKSFRKLSVEKQGERYFARIELYRPFIVSKKAELLIFDPLNGWYNRFHDVRNIEEVHEELQNYVFKSLNLDKDREDIQKKTRDAILNLGDAANCHIDLVFVDMSKEDKEALSPKPESLTESPTTATKDPPSPKKKNQIKKVPEKKQPPMPKPDSKTVRVMLKKDAPKKDKP